MAAASRLFMLLAHSISRNPCSFAQTPLPDFRRPCLLHSLRLNRRICSAVALDSEVSALSATAAVPAHPWPEWVNFVDQLKAKGYITSTAAAVENGGEAGDESAAVYRDSKLVKEACLSFARDRFDIFKSLPTSDIQAIVEKGCPSIFRKQVNSGKRLRAHLQLDEGDACSSCSLRDSCDRAYVLLTEFESVARTVDVVRILLSYAVDPLVVSGEVESKAPGREIIESSARRLLSALVELSETPVDPDLPKPTSIANQRKKQPRDLADNESSVNKDMKPGDWVCTECNFMNFARNDQCLKCKANKTETKYTGGRVPEMKRGDWNCPQCNFMNFARNVQCLKCKANKTETKYTGGHVPEMKRGDWNCPQCNFMNFARNVQCLKCKANGTERIDAGGRVPEMKKGDWNCPQCSFMNFSKNRQCFRCQSPRPNRQLKPGDWECPECDFLNFSRNTSCKKCNKERPEGSAMENGLHTWKQPY